MAMNAKGTPYYGMDGQPLTLEQWMAAFAARRDDPDGEWRIGYDAIGDVEISTVWLGLDHSWGMGPPSIFESMVFGGALDGECYRYATKEEAVAGHARLVRAVLFPIITATHQP